MILLKPVVGLGGMAEMKAEEIFQDCLSIMRLYHFLCVINYIIFIIFPPEMRIIIIPFLYIFFILNINCSVYLRRMLLMFFLVGFFPLFPVNIRGKI